MMSCCITNPCVKSTVTSYNNLLKLLLFVTLLCNILSVYVSSFLSFSLLVCQMCLFLLPINFQAKGKCSSEWNEGQTAANSLGSFTQLTGQLWMSHWPGKLMYTFMYLILVFLYLLFLFLCFAFSFPCLFLSLSLSHHSLWMGSPLWASIILMMNWKYSRERETGSFLAEFRVPFQS